MNFARSVYLRLLGLLPDEHGVRKLLYGTGALAMFMVVAQVWMEPDGLLWAKATVSVVFGALAFSMVYALATYDKGGEP